MTYLILLVLLSALYGWLGLWYQPTWKIRALFTALFIGIIGWSGLLYHESLSKPKSLDWELLRDNNEAKLLKHIIEPNVGLYLLLQFKDEQTPLYYYLPWGEEAEDLSKQIAEAEQQGNEMKLMMPFFYEPSLEKEKLRKIHPLPIPAMPPKEPQVIPGPTIEM
jgi:hypothetical protein